MSLTREELAHGRQLISETFRCPWHYNSFQIDCSVCEGGTTSVCDGKEWVSCSNPECDGTHAPCTFVTSPDEYPAYPDDPQVVATIDVPGMSMFADKNGAAICWLRNNAEQLLADAEQLAALLSASDYLINSGDTRALSHMTKPRAALSGLLAYAESLGWKKDPP